MIIARTTGGINKAGDAGTAHGQISSTDALQLVFPTTVSSYLTFHGSVRHEATENRKDYCRQLDVFPVQHVLDAAASKASSATFWGVLHCHTICVTTRFTRKIEI